MSPWDGSGGGTFTQTGGTNSCGEISRLAMRSSGTGVYNLDGGLLVLQSLNRGGGSASFNFNGGTLQAGSAGFNTSVPMMLGTSGGGATFDTAGYTRDPLRFAFRPWRPDQGR